jgi:hypothetical protein
MVKFSRLTLRPIGRFLTQWVSVSVEPTTFVREHIRLGDTTNFFGAINFFISAISTAFLAEVATLYLLGIGDLTESYYWLFILLTSIPFESVMRPKTPRPKGGHSEQHRQAAREVYWVLANADRTCSVTALPWAPIQ